MLIKVKIYRTANEYAEAKEREREIRVDTWI